MDFKLLPIDESDIKEFKRDMQEAFQFGAEEGGFPMDMCEVILPETDIDRSLANENAIAYKAVSNGEMLGGAVISLNTKTHEGELDFLYVKHGIQSRGIGRLIWFEIEQLHPEIEVWKTCTPYFEKRNIHFYINVCGFHITEYWNDHFKPPHEKEEPCESEKNGSDDGDGMFGFRKEIKNVDGNIHILYNIDRNKN